MQLNQLQRKTPNRDAQRVARGGKRGKTAGRGTKGQKARAGHRMRPELRDIIKKVPKNRGYKFKAFRVQPTGVNLSALDATFAAGDVVTPAILIEKGLIELKGGKTPKVKILGTGKLSKKLTVTGCTLSATAASAIAAAGGKVE